MSPALRKWRWPALGIVGLLLLAGAWRFTGLGDLADPERIAEQLSALARSPWAPLTLALLYLAANAALFPVIALNMALILALGAGWGVACALYASVLSGVAAFLLGRRFGQRAMERLDSHKVDQTLSIIRGSGVPGMILLRLVPVLPYPVINLILGAGGVRLWTFTLGTVLGLLPGLLAMGVVGFQLRRIIDDPQAADIAILAATGVAFAGLVGWARHRVSTQEQVSTQEKESPPT